MELAAAFCVYHYMLPLLLCAAKSLQVTLQDLH